MLLQNEHYGQFLSNILPTDDPSDLLPNKTTRDISIIFVALGEIWFKNVRRRIITNNLHLYCCTSSVGTYKYISAI